MTVVEPALRAVPRIPEPDLSDAALARITSALAEHAEEHDRTGEFPWAGIRIVHDAGLLTLGIGSRYGGRPLTATDAVRVFEAIGQGDPAVALITAMTVLQHQFQDRAPWWPEGLYRELVERSILEPQLVNAIRAEPEWGAPARGGLPATTIRRDGDGWVLSGRKGFATGSEGLAYHLVWAVDLDGRSGEPELGHAIVPAHAAGLTIERTWDHLGQRATSTHDVIYDEVRLPLDAFLGVPVSAMPTDRAEFGVSVVALYVGVARAAQGFFLQFAHDRVPTSLGKPIATTERIQTAAGEIEAQLLLAETMLHDVARRIDEGDPTAGQHALAVKIVAIRAAIGAVQKAVEVLGNPALTRHNPLERHLRDVLASRIHPPQEDAALLALGRSALARHTPAPTT